MRITAISAACLALVGISLASDVEAAIRRTTIIQAQGLAPALETLAKEREFQILYMTSVVTGLRTDGAVGEFTDVEAIEKLLSGTGLTYRYVDDKTVMVMPAAIPPPVGNPAASASGPMGLPQSEIATDSTNGQSAANEERTRNAQQTPEPSSVSTSDTKVPAPLSEVVVTGTNIKGVEYQASPVYSFSQEDIARTGSTDIAGWLRTVPQNFSGGSYGTTPDGAYGSGDLAAFNDTGSVSPNLRGLGATSTLTLVNGRRVAPSAQSVLTDISLIPVSAIERIDVVADGASAVYGADAVGGVVNVILRNEFEGIEASVLGSSDNDGEFSLLRGSIAAGNSWSSGGIFLLGSVGDYSPLRTSKRDFSDELPIVVTPDGEVEGTLYPDQEEYTTVLNARQQLSPRVELSADLWFGHRDREQIVMDPQPGLPDFYVGNIASVDEGSASLHLSAGLGETWTLDLTALGSETKEDAHVFIPAFAQDIVQDRRSTLTSFYSIFTGNLFELGSGVVKAAIGAEARMDRFELDQELRIPPTAPPSLFNTEQERDVHSAFVEMAIPLFERRLDATSRRRAELTVAVRHDSYDDVGDTTNYKVGLRIEPSSELAFRSTFSTSFRPPDLGQQGRRADFGRSLFGLQNFFPNEDGTGFVPTLFLGGTSELEPETSESLTAGVDFTPAELPGLKIGFTYFRYDFTDRLSAASIPIDVFQRLDEYGPLLTSVASTQQVLNLIDEITAEGGFVFVDDPAAYEFIVDGSYRNFASQLVSGIDLLSSLAYDTDAFEIEHTFSATYLLEDDRRIAPGSTAIDSIGLVGEQPRFRFSTYSTFARDRWNFTVGANYASDFRNQNVSGRPTVDEWITFDISGSFRLPVGNDSQVTLSINNIFDEDPPFARRRELGPNYDPANASPLGQVLTAQIVTRF